jgi:hypothetical protein
MDAAGRLDGRIEARFRGELAAGARASYRDSEDGRIEYWKEIVADHWPGSEFAGYERVAGDEEGAFVERIRFSLAGARGGFVQLVLEPSRWLGKASVRRREVPVTYRHPREVRFRARVGGLAGAVTLPNPISRSVDGLTIEASVQRDGATVFAEGRVTLSKTRFSPDEFRSLRRAYAAMRSLASMGFRAP